MIEAEAASPAQTEFSDIRAQDWRSKGSRASIRRLDWRFLLPAPSSSQFRVLEIVGGPAGLAEMAEQVGIAATVIRPADDEKRVRSADVVAVLADADSLGSGSLADRLGNAEVVWWEVDRRRAGSLLMTPRRARRRMRRAGLTPVAVYWAKGGHGSCTMYLPVGSSAPRRWYFHSVLQAWWPVRWFLRLAERLTSLLPGDGIAALVPSYGIVARRDPTSSTTPVTPMTSAVLAAGSAETPAPESAAMLLYGEGDWSRVVHVPFLPGQGRPTTAVKYPRLSVFNETTLQERRTLLALKRQLGEMRTAVPQPIAEYEWNGLAVTVEGWIDGRAMFSGRRGHARGRSAVRDLEAAADWLARMHTRTMGPAAPLAAYRDALVSIPAERYLAMVGDSASERALIDAFSTAASVAGDAVLGRVMEHRDFGPWNIYRTPDGLAVIDWEVAEPGFPLCDLLYFAMHWCWITTGASGRDREVEVLLSLLSNGAAVPRPVAAARAAISGYLRAMDLDTALLPIFFIHLLLRQAVDLEARRAARPHALGTRSGNRYAEYVRALAGHFNFVFDAVGRARKISGNRV